MSDAYTENLLERVCLALEGIRESLHEIDLNSRPQEKRT